MRHFGRMLVLMAVLALAFAAVASGSGHSRPEDCCDECQCEDEDCCGDCDSEDCTCECDCECDHEEIDCEEIHGAVHDRTSSGHCGGCH